MIRASIRPFERSGAATRAEAEHKPWLRERVGRSAQQVRRQVLARPRGRLRAPCAKRRAKPRAPCARPRARRQRERPPRRRRHRHGRRPRNGLLHARRRRGNLPRARRRPASLRWRRSPWQLRLLHLSRQPPPLSRRGPQCPWPSRSGRPPRPRRAWEAAAWHRGRQRLWEGAPPHQVARHVRQRREPRRARSLTGPLGRATTTICRRLRGRAGL